ncbi:hypothetical protein EV368DRAFT_81960 [Lentinula lateritia]|nr:hypothetical protein EV368DRAFT_81960 [Lentinula lateritia]
MAPLTHNAVNIRLPRFVSSRNYSPQPINCLRRCSVPLRLPTPPSYAEIEPVSPPPALSSGSLPLLSASCTLWHSLKMIPKPPGEVRRPGRGGYNLRKIMNWPKQDYDDVKDYIKLLVEHLDCDVPFGQQPLIDIRCIRDEAIAKFDFLAQYDNTWVVDDFVRCRLMYLKTLARNRKQRGIP